MLTARLYVLQRLSALVMIPLVAGHLAVVIYAIQDGLTVGEILGRTQGSIAWFLFYGLFVVAVAVHGSIGLRVIVHETLGIKGGAISAVTWVTGLLLFVLGSRAVWAVTFADLSV